MKLLGILTLTALLLASQSVARAADELVVYPPLPGLAASEHYKVRVRSASDGNEWQSAFAWQTFCQNKKGNNEGYFDHLAGRTHTPKRSSFTGRGREDTYAMRSRNS